MTKCDIIDIIVLLGIDIWAEKNNWQADKHHETPQHDSNDAITYHCCTENANSGDVG